MEKRQPQEPRRSKLIEPLSWLALAISIAGNLLINNKSFWGFPAWFVSNCIWMWFDLYNNGWKITEKNRARVMMHIVYSGMNIHGLINWLQGGM